MRHPELIEKIGTFRVSNDFALGKPFSVRDDCEFNNWGVEFFRDERHAIAYATWAHRFKTGRTFSEFEYLEA